MTPSRNNPGLAHENGAVESAHGHLKRAIEDALLLRGARDFADLDAYRRFIDEIVGRRNARRRQRIELERAALQPLPERRTSDHEEAIVTVTSSSGFVLRKVFYSVPSRLIGHRLRVRLHDDRLEVYLSGSHQLTLARGQARAGRKHGHVVDYRHVIHALRLVMALMGLVYRDQLFPHPAFARTFEALAAALPARTACRTMIGLLALARASLQDRARARAAATLDKGRLPDLAELQKRFLRAADALPAVAVTPASLAAYPRSSAPSVRSTWSSTDRRRPPRPGAERAAPASDHPGLAGDRRPGRQGGLAGGALPGRARRARDRRARPAADRASSRRGAPAAGQDARQLQHGGADGQQGAGHRLDRRRQLARQGRQSAGFRQARRRQDALVGRDRAGFGRERLAGAVHPHHRPGPAPAERLGTCSWRRRSPSWTSIIC